MRWDAAGFAGSLIVYILHLDRLATHVMILDDHWKYIRNRFDIDELYDLNSDPDEMQNISDVPEHQNLIAQMLQQIAEMVRRTDPGPYEWVL
ncbi:MAG: DUF4976 domain-containing protein [Candidatus Poribacteria bacterium]|nr:DUF4976 domain-containing protein [Candidatus Poribacteria bacterium]